MWALRACLYILSVIMSPYSLNFCIDLHLLSLLKISWEWKLVQLLCISVWWFLRKLGSNLLQDPTMPLLGIYPKDAQSYHKDICSTMFIAALFVMARTWKQPKCPLTKEWIRKLWYIHTMECYTAEKNTEWGNSDPERQLSCVLTHKWLLDINQRKPAYNSQS